MNEHVLFHGSLVREMTPFSVTERNAAMPLDIFPCFLGSRVLALGIDATGMQGLDCRVADYPMYQSVYGGSVHLNDDLFIFHSGMKSNHATRSANTAHTLRMPMGWVEYQLAIDGERYDAEAIAARATAWQRMFDIDPCAVHTRYELAGVQVSVRSYLPIDAVTPVFNFAFVPTDGQTHDVRVQGQLRLTMRTGEPLFTELPAAWTDTDATGLTLSLESDDELLVLEPYTITIGVGGGVPIPTEDGLAVEVRCNSIPGDTMCATIQYYFGSSQTNTDGDDRCRVALAAPLPFVDHAAQYAAYWAQRARISTGDLKRDWLYHFSLYLTEMGTDTRFGAGCCGNFVPLHLSDATFWDSHYMMDGLLHAGALAHAEAMVRWLHRSMGTDGKRPFYWMVHYTGETLQDDTAYTSIAAHATTAIKVGMATRDMEVRRLCNEIVQYVAAYAIAHFFEQTPTGWILGAPATTDITFSDEFVEGAKNNTFTHLWFLNILSKAVEFAEAAGVDYSHTAACRAITGHYYLEQNDMEYLDQRDGRGGERWDSYLPILCYPTEGHRWIDANKYHTTRMRHDHYCSNLAVQHFKMPWPMCWGAASDLRVGQLDAAEQRIATAAQYAYGPGYLCEDMSEGFVGMSQPYISTTGTYLTVQSEQLFYTDYYQRSIGLFAKLGRMHELRDLSFERLHGWYGLSASASYTTTGLTATLTGGEGQTFDLEIGVPYGLRGEALAVTVNGEPVDFTQPMCSYEDFLDADNRWRTGLISPKTITLSQLALDGETTITISAAPADTASFTPDHILLYDFTGLGIGYRDALRETDLPICMTNKIREFFAYLPKARFAIFSDGVSDLSPKQRSALEAFVAQGGTLVLFFEAGLESPHSLHMLAGVAMTHVGGHRWEMTPGEIAITRTADAPAELPAAITFHDLGAMQGTVAADTTILYTDAQGQPYCTQRQRGEGCVIWMAAGRPYLTRRAFLQSVAWRHWFASLIADRSAAQCALTM